MYKINTTNPAAIKRCFSAIPKLSKEDHILRKLLFLNHSSCLGECLYGDDGEMHCHTCDIDFVRDSAEDIQNRISDINLINYSEAMQKLDSDLESDGAGGLKPGWALKRADDLRVNTALSTRDGRCTGNAIIFGVIHRQETLYLLVTDAGNVMRMNADEIDERFHKPEWVAKEPMSHLKNSISAHLYAELAGPGTSIHNNGGDTAEVEFDTNASPDSVKNRISRALSSELFASFQMRVAPWMLTCFGEKVANDTLERGHRFLEESLELFQACGCTSTQAHQLVDYVFGRPVGEKSEEAGAVMLTLAALCLAHKLDMQLCAENELIRVWGIIDKIQYKFANKPKFGPLPE